LVDNIIDIKRDDFVLQYGDFDETPFFRIPAEGLLLETDKIRQDWKPTLSDTQHLFYAETQQFEYLLPYDIFSSVFYCLSFYQAYGNVEKDIHQRIDFKTWNLRVLGLDQTPVVEQWLSAFKHQLLQHSPEIEFKSRKFNVEISFDIDDPFQFRHQSLFNTLKGFAADVLKFRPKNFTQRFQALIHQNKDGVSNFFQLLDEFKLSNLRFFHLMCSGEMNSRSLQGEEKKDFVLRLNKYGNSGLHPSYHADSNSDFISEEKLLLESMLGQSVSTSRQHFLRFSIPTYFQSLINHGISDDYSIGYYDQPGFMAGVSVPFFFYDLSREEETQLLLHPFVWMDSMYKYYADSSQKDQVFNDFEQILMSVKTLNGCFHAVFHNDTFFNKNQDESIQKIFSTLSRC
jgi:hypothetical protein